MTGFICVDKAEGVSSAAEVNVIKKLTKTPCGHMGTLDPMASGVLPVAIGNAARLFDYFLEKRKTYVAVFRFGVDSDTLDTTGQMRLNAGNVPTKEQISKVLNDFVGEINQVPPRYSAKNVSGMRSYELARKGVEFELPPKKVTIYSLNLLEQKDTDSFSFKIECGGGTYIRSLARDLGKRLTTCAVMSALKRTESGVFSIERAVQTSSLTAENIKEFIIPTESVLPFDGIYTSADDAKRLFNGLTVQTDRPDGTYKIFMPDGTFYGLAEVNRTILKVRKKLC